MKNVNSLLLCSSIQMLILGIVEGYKWVRFLEKGMAAGEDAIISLFLSLRVSRH